MRGKHFSDKNNYYIDIAILSMYKDQFQRDKKLNFSFPTFNQKLTMLYRILIVFLLLFSSLLGITQSKKELRKARPVYINLEAGVSKTTFRDFANSPLFYKGNLASFSLGRTRVDSSRETTLDTYVAIGNTTAQSILQSGISNIGIYQIAYTRLYKINTPLKNWNTKIGGSANAFVSVRSNPSLLNNNLGYEAFFNLFGCLKLSRDVSRKSAKTLKIWFFKKDLKPRTKNLGIQINAGLLNSNLRNGYAYISDDAIVNDANLLDGYKFNFLSGYRMQSELYYTWVLSNGNAVKLAYRWNVLQSGKQDAIYQLAQHTIGLSLNFKTK